MSAEGAVSMKRQVVVFRIGNEEFAVDILATKEVVGRPRVTPVPETAEYVEGVMNLRGSLIPVLDLRKRLRAQGSKERTDERVIISIIEEKTIGLIVDGTSEVLRITNDEIEEVPDVISEIGASYIEGIIAWSGRHIALIDLNKALSGEVLCELDEVMSAILKGRARENPVTAA
jgi:purine-binding chemotaxis protein CheW